MVMHLLGFNRYLYSWIYVRTRTDRDGAKGLFYATVSRNIPTALGYTVLPWVAFVIGFILVAWLRRALLYTPYDFHAAINRLPMPWDSLVGVAVHYGIPFVLGWFVYRHFRRRMQRIIDKHISTPLCIHCEFDLSDQVQSDTASVLCTDCGNETPYYPYL